MKKITLIDGKRNSLISVFNRLVQFGDGLFETMVFDDGQIVFWSYHLKRLNQGCDVLSIPRVSESLWLDEIAAALAKASFKSGVIKLILSRGQTVRGYGFKKNLKPVRIIEVFPAADKRKPTVLTVCNTRYGSNQTLAGIKHCNRLEQVLAAQEISEEGLMLDEASNVISTVMANVFIIKKSTLITPDLTHCGVAGTRRDVVFKLANELKLPCKIKKISLKEVLTADAVFITNTLLGIQAIERIDNRHYDDNALIDALSAKFTDYSRTERCDVTQRKKGIRWRLMVVLAASVILAISAIFAINMVMFANQPISEREGIIDIKKHSTLSEINHQLAGIMPSYLQWSVLTRWLGYHSKLQSGYYRLSPDISTYQLLVNIASGNDVKQTITFTEGHTIEQFYQQMQQHPGVVVDKDLNHTLAAAGVPTVAQGWLFPDSYRFKHNVNLSDVFASAYHKMQRQLDGLWLHRRDDLPYQTPYEAVVLASLIEKETAYHQEKEKIAGVFIRRLNKKMRLQSDASVIYALGKAYQGSLKRQDLMVDSPFNTYRYHGLPPSAIGSVGIHSLRAAFNPDDSNNLYFVAKPDHTHHFSQTYKEHREAIKQYLKLE